LPVNGKTAKLPDTDNKDAITAMPRSTSMENIRDVLFVAGIEHCSMPIPDWFGEPEALKLIKLKFKGNVDGEGA